MSQVNSFRPAFGGRVTKWKGRAVGVSPALGVLGAALFVAAPLQAGSCVETTPGNWTCSGPDGPTSTTHVLSNTGANAITVATGTGFGSTTLTPDGLTVTNSAAGTDLTVTAGAGTATSIISAENSGSGQITIDTTGAQSGNIIAYNYAGTNLSIHAGNVTAGGYKGILASNFGSGSLTIDTTAGTVNVENFSRYTNAIEANNQGTDLIVKTADVRAYVPGGANPYYDNAALDLGNNGTGRLSVDTTAGTITGGINARNNGTSMDITTADVSHRLLAINKGSGALSIDTTAGSVSSDGYDYAIQAQSANGLSITTGDVQSDATGISATHTGSGNLSVAVQGTVAAGTGPAVVIDTTGNATINVAATGALNSISGTAIRDASTGAASTSTVTIDGALNGGIEMGAGSDTISFGTTATLGAGITLDGGAGSDSLNFATGVSLSGDDLTNWENIEFSGTTNSSLSGTLNANTLTLGGGVNLNLTDGLNVTGNVQSAGAALSMVDNSATDRLQIDGDLTGSGLLSFDVNMQTGAADMLQVNGDVTGTFDVAVNPLGLTAEVYDIALITVSGTTNPGDFTLSGGPISFAGFDFDLVQSDAQTWGLRSDINISGTTFSALPAVLMHGFGEVSGFQDRMQARESGGTVSRNASFDSTGAADQRLTWATISHSKLNETIGNGRFDSRATQISAGLEIARVQGLGGTWVFDATTRLFDVSSSSRLGTDSGSTAGSGLSFGLAAAWIGHNDTYVDLQGQIGFAKNDIADSTGFSANDTRSTFTGLRAELGKRFALSDTQSLTLHTDLSWLNVDADAISFGALNLTASPGSNQQTTVGIGADYRWQLAGAELRATAELERRLGNNTSVTIGPNTFTYDNSGTYGSVELGAVFGLSDRLQATVSGRYTGNLGNTNNSDATVLSVGLRAVW